MGTERDFGRGGAFFDRDGTLTVDRGYTYRIEDLVWQPGAVDAIRACNDAGRVVIVVTNQSGVARGYFDEDQMHAFHAAMQAALQREGARIDAFYHCPYHSEGSVARFLAADHPDRKPNPGMVRRALVEWSLEPGRCFMVGDTDADTGAAAAAGIRGRKVAPGELLSAVRALCAETDAHRPTDHVAALRDRAARARAWLFDHALPLWWEKGFDRATGQFFERLTMDTTPAPLPRRIRVQARQTAVYAHAGRLGWNGPWREAVDAGVQVLLTKGRHPDGGVVHMLDPSGAVHDTRRDLYDLAFVIYALAEAAAALGQRGDLIAEAERHVAWLEANWRHPEGGFLEGDVTTTPPRRQNPHMHLFEALLSLHEASGKPEHLARAGALAGLCQTRLFDPDHGALPEYFTDAWGQAPGEEGAVCEPGHQFEWSWLLHRWADLGGADADDIAERLRVKGEAYGVDPGTGVTWDEFALSGAVRARTSRLWPHTERLKAQVIRLRKSGDVRAAAAAVEAFDVLSTYFETPVPGLWRDRRLAEGGFVDEPAPASSFYHIMVALHELIAVGR